VPDEARKQNETGNASGWSRRGDKIKALVFYQPIRSGESQKQNERKVLKKMLW
jgi:hypothetical protein